MQENPDKNRKAVPHPKIYVANRPPVVLIARKGATLSCEG